MSEYSQKDKTSAEHRFFSPEIVDLVTAKLQELRKRLLDPTRRNPLINIRFSARSNSVIRVVDELPDVLRHNLTTSQSMRLKPLPALEDELPDERTDLFLSALYIGRKEDKVYLTEMDEIDPEVADAEERAIRVERRLKDRIRVQQGLSPRQTKEDLSLTQHARNHGIEPNYILPLPKDVHEDGRHNDFDIQTLLLPDRLSRSAKSILEKGRSFERETGVNVFHAVFGLLEWKDPAEREKLVSPLLLLEVRIDRKQSPKGAEFHLSGVDITFVNTSLDQKLRSEHRLALPNYEGGTIEDYFVQVQKAEPKGWHWRVRREVAFGIFPSSKIAMYHDLDPDKREIAKSELIARLLATTGTGDGSYAETYETDDSNVSQRVPYLVLDADASQYSALVDVADGLNLAIEGPPGSGKSQTIVNLIAAALADNKKVLFVAEKLSALDVVKSRLLSIGFGNFILPLQVRRRTTESIYESIENRLEMGRGDPRSQLKFEGRQSVLEKRRLILQNYLNVLEKPFGNTGLTVHQIIGHAIASAEIRESLPREIRRIEIPAVDRRSEADIETLVNEAEAFGKRLDRISNMPLLWRASTIPITRQDAAEDAAEEAYEIATEIEAYTQDIHASDIAAVLTSNPFTVDMKGIGKLLQAIATGWELINPEFIHQLIDKESHRVVRNLCSQIKERQIIVNRLARTLRDPEGWNMKTRLKEARKFAVNNSGRLAPAQHTKRFTSLSAKLETVTGMATLAKALPHSWTTSGRPLSEIYLDVKRICAQDVDILALRRADPNGTIAEIAKELESKLSNLSIWLGRIRQAMTLVDGSHAIKHIRSAAYALDNAGTLRFLSSTYKAARNTYINILGGQKIDSRRDMARRMRNYADWIEERCALDEDTRFKERFGTFFRGFNTNVEDLRRIVAFYSLVAEISAGSENLKQYLEAGDLAAARAFAKADTAPEMSLSDLETQLRELREAAETEEYLISESKNHLEIFRAQEEIHLTEIDKTLAQKEEEGELSATIENSPAAELLGQRFLGTETRTDILAVECDLAEAISEAKDSEVAIATLESGRLATLTKEFEAFSKRHTQLEARIASFCKDLGLPEDLYSTSALAERTSDLREAAADPQALLDNALLKRAEDSLREEGLGALIDWAINKGNSFDQTQLGSIVRALVAQSIANTVYTQHKAALLGYDGQDFNQIRAEIAEKDRELIKISRNVIVNKLLVSAQPPAGNNIGRKSSFSEMSLIHNELHKKKRRIGIRELTRRAGKALLELKPCWMMSPLAVAQYLHEDMYFDLVVIDEASQMYPENAIGALSRASQAVIVGDTKQLPPTNFFQKILDDSDTDEDLREDSESILDMANVAFMPIRQLRWHYRSRHSGLIQFSNQWMYNGELTIFPSALEDHPDLGVELIEVPGAYRSQRNEIEACAVVSAAVHHMEHQPDLSLGICTMSSIQKDLILEEFERERDRNPKVQNFIEKWETENDALDEFFIKNLETIQGDERDVMFISTLYGPEQPGGRVLQRFGPINSAYGHRRLNVLFTRAKRKIVTFTSMKPSDILVDGARNRGVKMLRAWIEYCKSGSVPEVVSGSGSTESPFEDYVVRQVERLGFEAIPQVGVAGFRIDIGVRHPEWPYGFILGIECDGATYHSSKSSRDRDRLRQEILEERGWRLHRIWSTDWFRNPRKEIEILREKIDAALTAAKAKSAIYSKQSEHVEILTQTADDTVNTPTLPPIIDHTVSPSVLNKGQVSYQPSLPLDSPAADDLFAPRGARSDSERSMASEPIIAVGSRVKVKNITDGGKKLAFTLVEEGNDPQAGNIGVHTPLGNALIDAQTGDEVEYQVGSYIKVVRILEIQ